MDFTGHTFRVGDRVAFRLYGLRALGYIKEIRGRARGAERGREVAAPMWVAAPTSVSSHSVNSYTLTGTNLDDDYTAYIMRPSSAPRNLTDRLWLYLVQLEPVSILEQMAEL